VPSPSIDWTAVRAAAVRLALPRTLLRGRAGERLGSGTGSSLEFQEHRSYSPGDDLRHVDWAAYARSELLAIRLYREEVAPCVDLVLDVSRSMAVTAEKLRAHGELSALVACACASTAADSRVITVAGSDPAPLRRPEDVERLLDCALPASALEAPYLPLRRRSLRIVISDFLFPHDADALVARLARESASLALVQLTLGDEAEPEAAGGLRLIDVEDRGTIDMVVDDAAVRDYRARFGRLRLALSHAARRSGARFVHLAAGLPVREVARRLAAAGVLDPT